MAKPMQSTISNAGKTQTPTLPATAPLVDFQNRQYPPCRNRDETIDVEATAHPRPQRSRWKRLWRTVIQRDERQTSPSPQNSKKLENRKVCKVPENWPQPRRGGEKTVPTVTSGKVVSRNRLLVMSEAFSTPGRYPARVACARGHPLLPRSVRVSADERMGQTWCVMDEREVRQIEVALARKGWAQHARLTREFRIWSRLAQRSTPTPRRWTTTRMTSAHVTTSLNSRLGRQAVYERP